MQPAQATAQSNGTTGAPAFPAPNPEALNQMIGRMLGDMGAVISGSLIIVGDRLGLYEALAKNGPMTASDLAEKKSVDRRYLEEWLACQAASGYVTHEAGKYSLTPEQAAIFADPESPVSMVGGFYAAASAYNDEPKVTEAFRTGEGIAWGEHHQCLFCGTERFFRGGYSAYLTQKWIPALDGVVEKLRAGGRVADVGCGHGASTVIMARAYPNSEFVGFDIHPASIERANEHAQSQGLTNLRFEVATAKNFPGKDYDLVTVFDALHDMGDPVGASVHVREALKPDGTWMIVEPFAGDTLEENMNPVGRVFYGFSTMICTPGSRSQEVGLALGAQAGEKRLRGVVTEAGFTHFRRATETPFNLILEARP
jgi:SAM-dependent methyltransferase